MCQINTAVMKKELGCIHVLGKKILGTPDQLLPNLHFGQIFLVRCGTLILSPTVRCKSIQARMHFQQSSRSDNTVPLVFCTKLMCHCILKYPRTSNWKRQAQTSLSMRTKMLHWFATPLVNPNPPFFGEEKMENHSMSKDIRKWVGSYSAPFPVMRLRESQY